MADRPGDPDAADVVAIRRAGDALRWHEQNYIASKMEAEFARLTARLAQAESDRDEAFEAGLMIAADGLPAHLTATTREDLFKRLTKTVRRLSVYEQALRGWEIRDNDGEPPCSIQRHVGTSLQSMVTGLTQDQADCIEGFIEHLRAALATEPGQETSGG